jgi:hypothetical protein
MPTPIEHVGAKVEAEYRVVISWDFKANLSDLPPEGIKVEQEKLGSVPLRGDWAFRLASEGDTVVMELNHGPLAYAALGKRVTVSGTLAYFIDGTMHQVSTEPWSVNKPQPGRNDTDTTFSGYSFWLPKDEFASAGKSLYVVRNSVRRFRFTITLTREPEGDAGPLYRTPVPDLTKALQLASASTFLKNMCYRRMLTDGSRYRTLTLAVHGRALALQAR